MVLIVNVSAQSSYSLDKNIPVLKQWVVDFSADENLEVVALKDGSVAPAPYSKVEEVKKELDSRRRRNGGLKSKVEHTESVRPNIVDGFNGKPIGATGIPLDNTVAVSNDGVIVSAINTNVNILDQDGKSLKFRTLSGMVQGQLGILDRYYDPKVLYDPGNDRFILVFLEGSNSSDTRIVVGFTQTKDPTGLWNFFAINGNPNGGAKWSDYPIIAHNETDLYITVNILRDNESWQEGFVQSVIWQVDKASGYQGDSLVQNLFQDITYGNKPIWSICPVQPAIDMGQKGMFFLSVRPDATSNDTVFLHEINNTAVSGTAQHTVQVLRSDEKYGVPPSAFQPQVGYKLQTNDTRVLSATLHGNKIQYVQSTNVPATQGSGIYHGTINKALSAPSISGRIISSSTMDYAYPSIAFAGETSLENSMMMTFSHVSETDYPGTSAIFYSRKDGLEDFYSPVVMVKEGDSVINSFLADSIERWGDYTDIQPQYNDLGSVWLCGSYGDETRRNNVWIAKIRANNTLLSVEELFVYPNPSNAFIKVSAVFDRNEKVDVVLMDYQGRVVKRLDSQAVEPGDFNFLVNVSGVVAGNYVLSILSEKGYKRLSKKVRID